MKKTIVITGASKGVGLAITQRLVEEGHEVIGIGRQSTPFNNDVRYLSADLTVDSERDDVVKTIQHHVKKIDVLINNMGMYIGKNCFDLSREESRQLMQTNFIAPADFTQQLLPLLQKGQAPLLIYLSSKSVKKQDQPNMGIYSASKAAVTAFANSIRTELNPQGIRVTVLHPNAVNTWGASDQSGLLTTEDMVNTLAFVLAMPAHCQLEDITLSAF
jgi:short-subunit dehydrogenase